MSNTASNLRISGVVAESIVDGPGFRYVVFTQGCPHHCPGCHNPQTHSFEGGYDADIPAMLEEIRRDPLLDGITLSGGEPFCQPEALIPLAKAVKEMGKTVFAYTGYTLEQLWSLPKAVRPLKNCFASATLWWTGLTWKLCGIWIWNSAAAATSG